LRTKGVRDEAGCNPRRVVGANRGQRQGAAQCCCHKDDDSIFSALSPAICAIMGVPEKVWSERRWLAEFRNRPDGN
jgi:hypothetical protein